ncbi:hypothetical protein N7486_005176 [Penicillium sp. IBT 16267x]|nr:hypothetical protein N7486_005176 [Penicillium sp. IBT 16267x]
MPGTSNIDENHYLQISNDTPDAPAPAEAVLTNDPRFPGDSDRYDVERVLDKKVYLCGRHRTPVMLYLIKWASLGHEHEEWVREQDAISAEELIQDFENSRNT